MPSSFDTFPWSTIVGGRVELEGIPSSGRRILRALRERDGVQRFTFTDEPAPVWGASVRITNAGSIVGFLTLCEAAAPVTEADAALLGYVAERLGLFLSHSEGLADLSTENTLSIDRMLRGYETDAASVEPVLRGRGWGLLDFYRVAVVRKAPREEFADHEARYVAARIRQTAGDALVFPFGEGIVIIGHARKQGGSWIVPRRLSDYVERSGMVCAVSQAHQSFLDTRNALLQCELVLAYAHTGGSERAVCLFDESYKSILLGAIGETAELESLCDLRLLEAVREGNAGQWDDYVASLRAYLGQNGNLTAAARELHVHRNTLKYRLERMGETLGQDLFALTGDDLLRHFVTLAYLEEGGLA